MKIKLLVLALSLLPGWMVAEGATITDQQTKEIHVLIDAYSQARAQQDTAWLERILTSDVDQLVSSGEWRKGKAGATKGMLGSSTSNPGTRSFIVESVRLLNSACAIVDTRYDIQNPTGGTRKMWSTFIVVKTDGAWKISAIRNMLPTGQQ